MRDHIDPWENAVWNTNERYEKHRSNQKSFDFPDHYQLLARLDYYLQLIYTNAKQSQIVP